MKNFILSLIVLISIVGVDDVNAEGLLSSSHFKVKNWGCSSTGSLSVQLYCAIANNDIYQVENILRLLKEDDHLRDEFFKESDDEVGIENVNEDIREYINYEDIDEDINEVVNYINYMNSYYENGEGSDFYKEEIEKIGVEEKIDYEYEEDEEYGYESERHEHERYEYEGYEHERYESGHEDEDVYRSVSASVDVNGRSYYNEES